MSALTCRGSSLVSVPPAGIHARKGNARLRFMRAPLSGTLQMTIDRLEFEWAEDDHRRTRWNRDDWAGRAPPADRRPSRASPTEEKLPG